MNHNSAPVEVREQFAFDHTQIRAILDAFSKEGAQESFILTTCNRIEFYVAGNPPEDLAAITARVIDRFVPDGGSWSDDYWYEYRTRQAVAHLFRVASGLDSLVLGEPEVLGQVKHAFEVARNAGTVGTFFNEVFKRAFHVAKRVRTETAIGVGAVSLASVTRDLLRRELGTLDGCRVLLVGTGDIARQVAQHLSDEALAAFYIASRTPERAAKMAAEFSAFPSSIAEALPRCDAVVTASACPRPLLSSDHVRAIRRDGEPTGQPFMMIDLGHPRNIAADVRDVPGVRLYALDDLRSEIEKNLGRRRAELPYAEAIVERETAQLAQWHTSLPVMDAVKSFRHKFEQIRREELRRMKSRLSEEEWRALDEASRRMLAKFLHTPTLALKALNIDDPTDRQKLALILDLFEIPLDDLSQTK